MRAAHLLRACFLFYSVSMISAGDPKIAILGTRLQYRIEALDISPTISLDDLHSLLDPIMSQYDYRIWVTRRVTTALSNLGLSHDLIQGYLRRRRRNRVRALRNAAENGLYCTQHRNTRPQVPSGRSDYLKVKRRAETQAALDAEIRLIKENMDKLGLNFVEHPGRLVENYDVLKGDLTGNNFGRIMYVIMEREGVSADFMKGYKQAIRRRSTQLKRDQDNILGTPVNRGKIARPSRKATVGGSGKVERANNSLEDGKEDDEVEGCFVSASPSATEGDAVWKQGVEDGEDVDESMATTSRSPLKEPLHHFQLPYTWYRGSSDFKEKEAPKDQTPLWDEEEMDPEWTSSSSGQETNEMQSERPCIAQKTYRGHQRPSTAFLTIHQ